MKKTISINIAGLVFNIEEDGYLVLKKYLDEIKALFSSEEGVNEMLEDIESRIAELFHEKLNDSKQVITEADVAEVKEVMGQPTDYKVDDGEDGDDREEDEIHQKLDSEETYSEKANKRLYRDEENATIGGVCAGLGHYAGVDPVVIRILFVLMVILGGSGILVYIILWVVIPEAKTTAQKLQMRGQPVNLDNIKEYVSGFTKDAKTGATKAASSIKKSVDKSGTVISTILKVLGKFIGAGFMIGGIIAIVIVSILFFGDSKLISFTAGDLDNNLHTLFDVLYPTGSSVMNFWSLFLIITLPLLAITSLGLKLLFNYKGKMKGPSLGGLIVWIVAICLFSYSSVELGMQFKRDYELDEEIESITSDSITTLNLAINYNGNHIYNTVDNELWEEHDYFFIDKESIEIGFPGFKILRDSTIDDYKVTLIKRSNGRTAKQALDNAKDIAFKPVFKGNSLIVPSVYSFSRDRKIRGQHVTLEIRVPLGESITLPESKKEMIYEIKATHSIDSDYFEKQTKWISSKGGMMCSNCNID
jgi:phage shock protein PspC (stress-responsive transcriptional regulator)